MKKRLFAMLLLVMGMMSVSASKWDVTRVELGETSKGVSVSFNGDMITYTISKDYDKKKVYFNISEDVARITEGKYVPGQSKPFAVRIINDSKFDFSYVKNSFQVITKDLSGFDSHSNYYSFDRNGKASGTYVKDTKSFDGQLIAANWSVNRTMNDALKKLYENSEMTKREKVNRSWKYVYRLNDEVLCTFSTNWKSNLCDVLLTDEILGAELVRAGYANGINDLDKYYLDYYNKVFKSDAKVLEDLPGKAIYGYMDSLNEYLGGILNGNTCSNRETNALVSSLGYNWFYNKGLGFYPIYDESGSKLSIDNTKDSGFYLGDYMRHKNTVTEKVVNKDLGQIKKGSTYDLTPIKMFIDFEYVVNAHENMKFGYDMGFELERKMGKLIVNYVDDEGNKLITSLNYEDAVGNPYQTELKEFNGYEFLKVLGDTSGNYIDGTIEVTYIYTKGIGDIMPPEEEQVVVKEEDSQGEQIEPPHTDADVSVININYLKKEDE